MAIPGAPALGLVGFHFISFNVHPDPWGPGKTILTVAYHCFGGSNTYSRGIWKTKVVHEGTKTLCLFGFFEVVVCFQYFFFAEFI